MNDIDAGGRIFLAIVAVGTLAVAASVEVEFKVESIWSAIAMITVWAVPWVIGGVLALSAATGSAPW